MPLTQRGREMLEEIVAPFGFTARQEPLGYFIAPVTLNRFGHRHVGDDEMLIRNSGEIVVYEHSAQAFIAAKALAAALAKAGK